MKELAQKIHDNIRNVPDFPQKGVQFKDITSLFQNPELCSEITDAFADFSKNKIDLVCGIESRGFLFGFEIAQKLKVPFVFIRKKGKLPPPVVSESYELEYGTAEIEIQDFYIKEGARVLIHDDILATGGTAEASARLIQRCGAIPVQFSFIAELDFLNGKEKLLPFEAEILSLVNY